METEQDKFRTLLQRYEAGGCSDEEISWLESWYLNLNELDQQHLSRAELDRASPIMWSNVLKHTSTHRHQPSVTKLWPGIAVVAAAVAAIVFGIWFFTGSPILNRNPKIVNQNDIAPGKNAATLTLADGKQIKLSDVSNGELAKQAGVSITKTADGKLIYVLDPSRVGMTKEVVITNATNTLSTAKGETYQVKLPDGSTVWLNAASSLTYSTSLIERGMRLVKLRGEAYFEISKDKLHPFIVKTNKQEVEVLGTHFNINAYNDEGAVKTTLLEGSVRVTSSPALARELPKTRKGEILVLKPGQQSVVTGNSPVKVLTVNTEDAVAWTNNVYIIDDQTIEQIMRTLARWYDVEVVYEGNIKQKRFAGTLIRKEHISKILDKISYTGGVHFKIEGRRSTVME